MKKKWFLLIIGLPFCCSLLGQCPSNDSVVHFSRYNQLPAAQRLNALLLLNSAVKNCPIDDSSQAILLNTIGVTYSSKGEYLEGIRYYNEAIRLIRSRLQSKTVNPGYLSSCYLSLSKAYDALHNRREKYQALDSCVKIGSRYNVFNAPFIYALVARAGYLYDIGDFKNCITYADRGQQLALLLSRSDPRQKLWAIQSAQYAVGLKINALLALKDDTSAKRVASAQFDMTPPNNYLGTIYGQIAGIESDEGRYSNAQLYFDSAFRFERKFGTTANCKVMLNNIGELRSRWANNKEAGIPYYLEAYRYKNDKAPMTEVDTMETVNALSNLGIAYSGLHKFDTAFYYFNIAYQYVGPGWNENSFLNSSFEAFASFSKLDYLFQLLRGKADAYLIKYETKNDPDLLNESIRLYTIIDKLLFRIKTEQSNTDSKLAWRENFHRMYENAMRACELQNNFEAAFYFMERSKAILLLDQLNEERWTAQYDILKQNQIKKQIILLTRQMESENHSSTVYDSLNEAKFRKQEELEGITAHIQANNPLYYQYSMDTSSLTIKDVQRNLLRDHAAFLEVFAGDSSIYAMLISKNKTQLQKIDKMLFDSLSKAFNHCVSNGEFMNSNYDYCLATSTQLYHLIFDKFSVPAGRIIISPDGKYFPFEALVTSQRSGVPTFFIEDHAVSYAYTARYLMNAFVSNSNVSSRNFLGMAPVQFASSLQLATLTGSDASIQQLVPHFSSADTYLSKEATRNQFLQNYYRYQVIQIYTHAADSGYNKEPVIYFSDSALLLSDLLYESPPATRLIVLSGCETGSGKWYEGEGVFGFNRGFAGLGVPSCIANLWQVENTSTYQLTELFYANLAKGKPLDVALQEAKKEFIKTASRQKQLPYYWAAPILTGRTDAIELKKNYTWIYIAAGICLLGFVVVAVTLPKIRQRARAI